MATLESKATILLMQPAAAPKEEAPKEKGEVLSVVRPLKVQRTPSQEGVVPQSAVQVKQEAPPPSVARITLSQKPQPTPKEPSPQAKRREFFHEEITHHAHVTMEANTTFCDVLRKADVTNLMYFACLVTSAMFASLGGELPVEWMIPAVSLISVGLFAYLRL